MICAECKTVFSDEEDYSGCENCQKAYCPTCQDQLMTGCGHSICHHCTNWVEEADGNDGLNGYETCPLCGELTYSKGMIK
jgi:hypothetical protein